MASITIALGSQSLVISKFVDSKLPRRHTDPSNGFEDDPDYVPLNLWEFTCLLVPSDAAKLQSIYQVFVNIWSAGGNPTLAISDTTSNAISSQSSFTAWFTKQPEYSEEGRFVRVSISLREPSNDANQWQGNLTIANAGGTLNILQRYLVDDRYPWAWSEPQGSSIEEDPLYTPRKQWNVVTLLTYAEATTLISIFNAFVAAIQASTNANLSVNDNTLIPVSSNKVWFVRPPEFSSEEGDKAKKNARYVKTSISLSETAIDDPNRWLNSLTVSNGGGTIVFPQKYMEDKFPFGYSQTQGGMDNDETYILTKKWEIQCRITKTEADALKSILEFYVNANSNPDNQNPSKYLTVADTTLYAITSNKVRFVEPPSFVSDESPEAKKDGRDIKVSLTLEESALNTPNRWGGALTISNNAGSLTFYQKFMGDKFPFGYNQPSGGNMDDDASYVLVKKWDVECRITYSEASSLRAILEYYIQVNGNEAAAQSVKFISVSDNTLFAVSSTQTRFTGPPSFTSEETPEANRDGRRVKVTFTLEESLGDTAFRWGKQITVANTAGSVTFEQKYLEDKFPFGYNQPSSGGMDDDETFALIRKWEIGCRITQEQANSLRGIFEAYVTENENIDQEEEDTSIYYVSVADTTLFSVSSAKVRFVEPPSFTSEESAIARRDGRFIKTNFSLEEALNDDKLNILKGALTISKGASVTFKQRHMEEKFPRIAADGSLPQLEYTILGASLLDGPPFLAKRLWNVVTNATLQEVQSVLAIETASNSARIARSNPGISVSDSTLGGAVTAQAVMVGYPQCTYNKAAKKRPYRLQFTLQEL